MHLVLAFSDRLHSPFLPVFKSVTIIIQAASGQFDSSVNKLSNFLLLTIIIHLANLASLILPKGFWGFGVLGFSSNLSNF